MCNRSFTKENAGFLYSGPAFLILLTGVAVLYEIRMEYVIYIAAIYVILFMIALGVQYHHYKQSVELSNI